MSYTIPSDSHVVGNSGHTTDHNNIADMLTLVSEYNVKNTAYSGGAQGNGSADDTAAIQAALTACRTSTYGGIVIVPPGIYLVSSILQIGSNTTLVGAGYGVTTIRMKSGSWAGVTQPNSAIAGISIVQSYTNTQVSNVALQEITFDGNEANITAIPSWSTGTPQCPAVGINFASGFIMDSCQIINSIGYSLWILSGSSFRVTNNRVLTGQSSGNGSLTFNQQDALHLTSVSDGVVAGNILDTGLSGVGDDCIALQSYANMTNISITGNEILHSGAAGIDLALSGTGNINYVSITGNTISNTSNSPIKMSPFVTGSVIASNITISGNSCTNGGTAAGAAQGVYLQDYTAVSSTGAGWSDVVVSGNSFTGNTNTSTGYAVIMAQQGTGLVISDNIIDSSNVPYGINVGQNGEPVNQFQVSGNTVNLSTSTNTQVNGITAWDSYDGTITGNTVIGNSASNTYGIVLLGQVDTCTGVTVTGNRVTAWDYPIGEFNIGAAVNYNSISGNVTHNCTLGVEVIGANTYLGGQQLIQSTVATTGSTGTGSQAITGLVASMDVGTYCVDATIPWITTGTTASTTTFGFSAATLTLSALSMTSLISLGSATAEPGTSALVTSTTLSDAMWTSPTHAGTPGYGQARFWGTLTANTAGTLQMVFANTTSADTVTMGAGATMLIRPLS